MTFGDSGVTFIHGEKAERKTNDVVEKSLNNILLKRGMTIQISPPTNRRHSKMCRDF